MPPPRTLDASEDELHNAQTEACLRRQHVRTMDHRSAAVPVHNMTQSTRSQCWVNKTSFASPTSADPKKHPPTTGEQRSRCEQLGESCCMRKHGPKCSPAATPASSRTQRTLLIDHRSRSTTNSTATAGPTARWASVRSRIQRTDRRLLIMISRRR